MTGMRDDPRPSMDSRPETVLASLLQSRADGGAMSQDEIDRLFAHLDENPADREKLRGLDLARFVERARAMGYDIEAEELQARQALIHMTEGT